MRRALFAVLLSSSVAFAQDAGTDAGKDAAALDAATAEMPEGHPPVDNRQREAVPDVFQPPDDQVNEDPSLPAGTIAVELRDADDRIVPNEAVTLAILQNSVAKGESRRHVTQKADAQGRTVFSGLEKGAGFAYRVTAPKPEATFSSSPFNLPMDKGMRVVLHQYETTSDIREALMLVYSLNVAEVKDDRIQFEQHLQVYILGRKAYVPRDVVLTLPTGFTALTAMQSMTDQGIDVLDKGLKLRGTFIPTGSPRMNQPHSVGYRWQLPWSGESQVEVDLQLPPMVLGAEMIVTASPEMKLIVDGFPEAKLDKERLRGQTSLVTAREVRAEEAPMKRLRVTIAGIPSPGPERFAVTGVAALAIVGGLAYAVSRRGRPSKTSAADAKAARQRLLADLEELERAHAAGDVGPKTYERARREIIDSLARTFVADT